MPSALFLFLPPRDDPGAHNGVGQVGEGGESEQRERANSILWTTSGLYMPAQWSFEIGRRIFVS